MKKVLSKIAIFFTIIYMYLYKFVYADVVVITPVPKAERITNGRYIRF